MPVTFWTFLVATIAIAGIPPLSGFWSKDEILASVFESNHRIIFSVLIFTAAMTSFYMFRLLFLTFFGTSHGDHQAHESPWVMTFPLILLAIGSIAIGLPGSPLMNHWFQQFLEHRVEEIHMNSFVVTLSITTSAVGFLTALLFYVLKKDIPKMLAQKYGLLYSASQNKLWFDELYQSTVIQWFKTIANVSFKFDMNVIDRGVNEVGFKTVFVSRIKNWIDQYIVDGLVNLTGWVARKTSAVLRLIQTGYIHHYLFLLLFGILIIMYKTLY